MTTIAVQRLATGDVEAARDLNALYADAFADHETYRRDHPDDAWLARQLAKDAIILLIARIDGRIVGGLTAYELPKLEAARSEIYLYDLAVAESVRRRGIATALITELQHIAAETGAWAVFVQADYVDPPAIALYTKLGVREDVLHFDLPPVPRATEG
ncbi:MAG: AAC(3)-I family aminoglycoside N-acetyltransferase [Alphaproteobacteria bacterium]|nr:AAC(3)-I family aminoglycoside N-acetyltransferase [Alphaproteobacteria bacterium]MBU0863764.1 AAC(3)-I family aminoglycoside N-acetyltransferase [Alphaproteobacteria bacterium]MBU1825359.1 AAC(3)-I family aminoglycoside N-acetyltransferase [Alphaproteobacteria bacterium]